MSELNSAEVEGYLHEHPEFFSEHLELLENISIPHPSGSAVSLISKQLELFRQRHHDMETELGALIEVAKENDTSASKMHELTLAVLEADTLDTAIKNLDEVLRDCFHVDFFTIKIISEEPHQSTIEGLFITPDCEALTHFTKEMGSNLANCGRPTLGQARFLFADNALAVRSSVIIPMSFTEIEGIIAIGSRDNGRFHYSMGHLFLTQMSEILATRFIALLKQA